MNAVLGQIGGADGPAGGQSGEVILVVEGPSAAGKTTWLRRTARPEQVVPEHGRVHVPADQIGEAVFWADLNAARWQRALATEAAVGSALCDGDPLKLHYDYCLARLGLVPWARFDAGVQACASAIGERRLGIADAVFCAIPDVETLEHRMRADTTRRRSNFEVNSRLGPALGDWYGTLSRLEPERVQLSFPIDIPSRPVRNRYDVALFDTWMADLPGRPSTDL